MGMLESWDLSKTILTRDGPGKKDNRCRQAGEGGKRETGRLWEIDVEVGGARTGDKVGKVQSKSLAMGAKKKKKKKKAKCEAGVGQPNLQSTLFPFEMRPYSRRCVWETWAVALARTQRSRCHHHGPHTLADH